MPYTDEGKLKEYNRLKAKRRRAKLKAQGLGETSPTNESINEQILPEITPPAPVKPPPQPKTTPITQKPVVKELGKPKLELKAPAPSSKPTIFCSYPDALRQKVYFDREFDDMSRHLMMNGWAGWYVAALKREIIIINNNKVSIPDGYPVFNIEELNKIGELGDLDTWKIALMVKGVDPQAELFKSEGING